MPVNDGGTVAGRSPRPFAAGPVAQWLEPAAHNGLVAGSSPAGPTKESVDLSSLADRDHCPNADEGMIRLLAAYIMATIVMRHNDFPKPQPRVEKLASALFGTKRNTGFEPSLAGTTPAETNLRIHLCKSGLFPVQPRGDML
jgi:hypothetical protein